VIFHSYVSLPEGIQNQCFIEKIREEWMIWGIPILGPHMEFPS
jgi:hypothetical protein